MTRDNEGKVNRDTGDPGKALEPADVIKCRECKNLVRRVNQGHLRSDRCKYTDPEKVRTNRQDRDDLLRPDHPTTTAEYKEKYPDAPVVSPRQRMMLAEANHSTEADERREELLRRRWRGESMSNIVSSLANKYDMAEDSVWRDWSRRSDWIERVFGLEDAEAVVVEALAQKQDVRERLLRVARLAEDENEVNAAVKALRAVDQNIDQSIEHQQKLGNVEKASQEHEVSVSGEVNHRHEKAGESLDEDTLRALDDITGGEDEEFVDAEFEEVEPEGGDE